MFITDREVVNVLRGSEAWTERTLPKPGEGCCHVCGDSGGGCLDSCWASAWVNVAQPFCVSMSLRYAIQHLTCCHDMLQLSAGFIGSCQRTAPCTQAGPEPRFLDVQPVLTLPLPSASCVLQEPLAGGLRGALGRGPCCTQVPSTCMTPWRLLLSQPMSRSLMMTAPSWR